MYGRLISSKTLPPLETRTTDDPAAIAEANRDDYAEHVVPQTWRFGKSGMIFAWSALLAAFFWIVLAASLSVVVGAEQAIIGMAAAGVVYSVINYILQKAAATSGLTVATFSRSLFGYLGAPLITIVYAISALWFAVFEGSVVAVAFQAYFGGPIELWYVVTVAYAIPLILGGLRVWLERVNKWLLPAYVGGLVAAVIWATVVHGYHATWANTPPAISIPMAGPGWLYAFSVYLGVFAMMLYTFDFARMGKIKDVRFHGWITFGPVFYVLAFIANGLFGLYLASVLPQDGAASEVGIVVGIVKMMGVFGLIFVFATQTKINSANLYLASSNLESFFSRVFHLRLPRWVWAVVTGLVMLAVMFTNVFTFILQWLSYQGVVLVAWTAIALVHIIYTGRKSEAIEFRPGRVPAINPGGIGAFLISAGFGIALLALNTPFTAMWTLMITFGLAAGLYAAALAFARKSWFSIQRPYDPRLEVHDIWDVRVKCHVCKISYVAVEMDRDPSANHEAICASCARGFEFRSAAGREANGQ